MTLEWSSTGATSAQINGVPVENAQAGSKQFTPSTTPTTIYTMTFTGPGGISSETVYVGVQEPNAPTATIGVDCTAIVLPQCANLTWSSSGAVSANISTIGSVLTSGTMPVCPKTTTTYVLTVMNAFNVSNTSPVEVTVTVNQPLIETTCEQIRKNSDPPKCLNVCYELVNGVTQSIVSADLYNDNSCTTDPNPTPLRVFKLNDPEKSIVCLPCNYQGSLPGAPICPANGDPAQGMPYHAVINLQHKNCDVFNYERQNLGATVVLGTDPWRFVNGSMVWFP